jgi:hypothetical protein
VLGRDEANVVVRCRRRIEQVFKKFAPERLDVIDELMRKYRVRCHIEGGSAVYVCLVVAGYVHVPRGRPL